MRRRVFQGLFVCVAAALSVGQAFGANISSRAISVTSGSVQVIVIEGKLDRGDEGKFADAAIGVPSAVVFLNSDGGNLIAGIEIGKAIRLKGFTTAVGGDDICASACALAWLGGQTRMASSGARIGFHAAFRAGEAGLGASGPANAIIGAYLGGLGYSLKAIEFVTEASPTDMRWLTPADAKKIGIDFIQLPAAAEPKVATLPASPSLAPNLAPSSTPRRPPAVPDQTGVDWRTFGFWIQIYSRGSIEEIEPLAVECSRRFDNCRVFLYANGWYGLALGPYAPGAAKLPLEQMIFDGSIPKDSFLVRGEKFVRLAWGTMPKPAVGATFGLELQEHQQKALAFVTMTNEVWSMENDRALPLLEGHYAPYVDFYGKAMSREDIIKEKRQFADRWPVRSYVFRSGPTPPDCDSAGSCVISGTVEWSASDPGRQAQSEGTSDIQLRLVRYPYNSAFQIVAESGRVISRR